MSNHLKFFIDGAWVEPAIPVALDVIDPSTEEAYTRIALGSKADVDKAVAAAKAAFPAFSQWSKEERLALLRRILAEYEKRYEDIAQAVSQEMGAPIGFARDAQAAAGQGHLKATIEAFEAYEFTETRGTTTIVKEPIGVCALITPWNWPLNQIVCKVAPAIAAGCTMVLKPSEIAPISGIIFAEVMEAAGTPKGVFNLVNGTGPDVGQVMAGHPDVDMVSFTGSTRAGVIVAKTAADTVKRVAQELGGKSPNIILADAEFEKAVADGVTACFANSGQSCDAPTRMLVPARRHHEALQVAKAAAENLKTGDPRADGIDLGPVVSQTQFDKIQRLIEAGIAEGATLVTGGPGRPENLNRGYYIRPTVFGNVTNDMTIAREEIFGPVLSILPYETEEQAIEIANDTPYGLAAYVQSGDLVHARKVAARLRAGSVFINYPEWDLFAPFGGFKQSGNGREYADWAIHDFLEIKGIVGYGI
ncbi:aldehyde dehydrogenase family protein [Neorhizobium galegae]|uniref:aldehyde dehydrogenase family protein n=1 Tax=Neorhizobium galegae TaxID=399 RepID=UPI001353CC6C|nr:aldehyde dehydrogenase family protein [Neorhizobium galegae]KAB1115435.1 aldehyde dehydrogenase family protein [Neorhizobium galegae]MCQ1773286.1 aldehyde dehydrogenase family protein [Neorhizobium galegae]MCQ1799867.1 aldehyde dehydrogenase family protein [Neorhizobium galegae]